MMITLDYENSEEQIREETASGLDDTEDEKITQLSDSSCI